MNSLVIYHAHDRHSYFDEIENTYSNVIVTQDFDRFQNFSGAKLATFTVPANVLCDYVCMPDDYQKSLNYVNSIIQAVNISDHSIFVMSEIHPCSINILKILDDLLETRKATAFVGAIYNNHYFNHIFLIFFIGKLFNFYLYFLF